MVSRAHFRTGQLVPSLCFVCALLQAAVSIHTGSPLGDVKAKLAEVVKCEAGTIRIYEHLTDEQRAAIRDVGDCGNVLFFCVSRPLCYMLV